MTKVKIYYDSLILHFKLMFHCQPFRCFQLAAYVLLYSFSAHSQYLSVFWKDRKEVTNIYRKIKWLIHLLKNMYLVIFIARYCLDSGIRAVNKILRFQFCWRPVLLRGIWSNKMYMKKVTLYFYLFSTKLSDFHECLSYSYLLFPVRLLFHFSISSICSTDSDAFLDWLDCFFST